MVVEIGLGQPVASVELVDVALDVGLVCERGGGRAFGRIGAGQGRARGGSGV
jgi:hypothetical protein